MLTVTTPPRSTRLASISQLMSEVQIQPSEVDRLGAQIQRASDAIVRYCNREFARAFFSEKVAGYGGPYLTLARRPVPFVTSVTYFGGAITDFDVDSEPGILYRRLGWVATAPFEWFLTGTPRAGQEAHDFIVVYPAGYLVPDDDRYSADLTVAAADQSVNDPNGLFPLLVAGDRITLGGFAGATNVGVFTIETRTATKITVAAGSGLVDETGVASGGIKRVLVATLPGDLTKAAIETTKAWERGRTRDPNVRQKSVGDLSITYASGGSGSGGEDLPITARLLLEPWRAVA